MALTEFQRANISTDMVLKDNVVDGDTGELVDWDSLGGGDPASAVGLDGKRTIWTPPTSAATQDDEFNDATGMSGPVNGLNAKWSKRNLGTASWLKLDDAIAPGALLFDIPTGQAEQQSIYQATPSGDFALTARVSLQCSDRQMWSLFIVDSAGTGASITLDTGDTFGLRTITTWGNGGSTTNMWSTSWNAQVLAGTGMPITMTLRKASGVYYGALTFGERAVAPGALIESSITPSAFTPAHIGFGRVFGSGIGKVVLDSFRKTA